MTRNMEILASIRADGAIRRAQSAHLPPVPPAHLAAMAALKEAIDLEAARAADLAARDRMGSAEYLACAARLRRWTAAWTCNR